LHPKTEVSQTARGYRIGGFGVWALSCDHGGPPLETVTYIMLLLMPCYIVIGGCCAALCCCSFLLLLY
jgi:hypothetical protein